MKNEPENNNSLIKKTLNIVKEITGIPVNISKVRVLVTLLILSPLCLNTETIKEYLSSVTQFSEKPQKTFYVDAGEQRNNADACCNNLHQKNEREENEKLPKPNFDYALPVDIDKFRKAIKKMHKNEEDEKDPELIYSLLDDLDLT